MQPRKTIASLVQQMRSCKCDRTSGCSAAAAEAEIIECVAALEEDRDTLVAALQGVSIGAAVLAVLEDNGLGEQATALANMRDRAHAVFVRMRNRA